MRRALAAEWTKLRTVPWTAATLAAALLISVALALLVGFSFRAGFANLPAEQRLRFDPLFATFYSLTLGQLAVVVFAVLAVGTEYGSGTIRASLAAMPRRGVFYAAKLTVVTVLVLGAAVVIVLATFGTGQLALGPHGTTISAPGVPEAIVGACAYLALIALFAAGITAMLRSSVWALVALLPLLFLGSQGLANVPKVKTVAQYLPDAAGAVVLHLTGPASDPRFGRPYGAWAGLAIMALWAAAAVLGGYLVLRRRDA